MKKITNIVAILLFIFILSSCGNTEDNTSHAHSFSSPTCKQPKICSICSKTKGSPIEHEFINGTCKFCYKVEVSLYQNYYVIENQGSDDYIINKFVFSDGHLYIGAAYGTAWSDQTWGDTFSYNGRKYYQGGVGGPGWDYEIIDTEIVVYDIDTKEIYLKLEQINNGCLVVTYSQSGKSGQIWSPQL